LNRSNRVEALYLVFGIVVPPGPRRTPLTFGSCVAGMLPFVPVGAGVTPLGRFEPGARPFMFGDAGTLPGAMLEPGVALPG
jgi:hypothetical protein